MASFRKFFRRIGICALDRHVPDEHHVRWDGLNYVGKCRKCGASIRREKRGVWHKDWIEAGAG